jgi:hypothetical protein
VLELQGKIEDMERKSDFSSLLIGKDPSGKPAIHGLQFSGKKFRIVF